MAEVLHDAGYTNGCIGKWAFSDDHTGPGAPDKQGWDYYYGEPNQTTVHSYYLPAMYEFDRDGSVSGLPPDKEMRKIDIPENAGGKRVVYSHDLLSEKALAFVKAAARKTRPFFLYLPYTIPHAELLVPEDSLNEYKGKFPEKPYEGRGDYSANDMPNATYAAMITRMDRDIGRILSLVGNLGIAGKTLVMFSSDNGPVSACGQDLTLFQSAGNLRGLKASLYEGGIRVPLIARWSGAIPPGTVSNHPGAFCDFLPTAVELAGGKTPKQCDGISIVPVLLSRPQEQKEHEFLYWETPNSQAVRMGNWKAIKSARGSKMELYDLSTDVSETTDVADKHPDVVAKIEAIMRTSHTDFPGAKKPAAKPKRARKRVGV